jgi:hypothetical protein
MNTTFLLSLDVGGGGVGTPNFVNSSWNLAGIVIYLIISICLIFLVISAFRNRDIEFKTEWYLVAVPIFWPLIVVLGIIISIINSSFFVSRKIFYYVSTLVEMKKINRRFRGLRDNV